MLRYGIDHQLELPAETTVVDATFEEGVLGDWEAALTRALDQPVDYPTLALAVTPGDRVVVACEPGVPQLPPLIARLVDYLVAAGVTISDICILQAPNLPGDAGMPKLGGPLNELAGRGVRFEMHDAMHRDHLGYLANTSRGRPVYLNRSLCDADLVVLVGCLRSRRAVGYHGPSGGLYPTFSDDATLHRFRSPTLLRRQRRSVVGARREAARVGWLAGAPFAIQVIPGPNGTVADLIAGTLRATAREGARRMTTAWESQQPRRADLVVAAISGNGDQQTWENFGRALAAADRLVDDDASIAICCDLEQPPGIALQQLAASDDWRPVLRQLEHDRPADLLTALVLDRVLGRGARIYLLSRLDEDTVESLNMIRIEEPAELARLIDRHDSCIVLNDAQFAWPTVAPAPL
jgi:nickel-dependent lactate racemase